MSFNEEYAKQVAAGHEYDALIRKASDDYGVNYDYLHKQLFMESRFKNDAKSPTGPRGVGQFTRATGAAYGLLTDADFFDPAKSIDAAGRHMRDILKATNGDYVKAGLMYNQGGGRLGRPQLAALDAGDLSKISPEGQKYMRNLLDVSGESPFSTLLGGTAKAPVSGKPETVTFEAATQGVGTVKLPVQRGAGPELATMGVKGADVEPLKSPFAQQEFDAATAPKGWFEGTGEAVKAELATSSLGQLFRNVTIDSVDPMDGYAAPDTSDWGDAEFARMREAGIPASMYGFVFDNARGNKNRLDDALAMAKENAAYQKKAQEQSMSAQIVAGFVGAAADPFTYAPVPGATGATLVSKVVKGATGAAMSAGASEALRSSATGLEAHYGTAMVGGALVGGGLTALIDRIAARAVPAPRLDMWDADLEKVLAMHGEAALPNEFHAPSMRLEARETARQTGMDDPSVMPWQPQDTVEEAGGVLFTRVPGEEGAVRLQDGSILSASNPLNPLTIEAFQNADRAARGVSLGGFTEIGYTLTRSANEEIRGIGAQLFRSTTGTQSGSNGKFGATASDIIERIQGQDHVSYNTFVNDLHEAIKDPRYAGMPGGREVHMEAAYRRVTEALEDRTGSLKAQLSTPELKLMESVNAHFERKLDALQNPAQFGNARATSVLGTTRHEGAYVPNVYDDAAKNLWIQRLGSPDDLQDAIVDSWLASYASRPHVKARVDKMIQESNPGVTMSPKDIAEAVETYARNKAYGISHTQDFNRSHLVDDQLTGLVGAENNNFLEGRHLFDSDMRITLGSGDEFAVNDLRSFDLTSITPGYDRRVNGDIGIMGATGQSTEALKDRITALGVGHESKKEYKALQDAVKILTGRARRDPDGALATLARSLTDMSFFAKNAYMGIQGITETAGLVTKGHTAMLLKGVPFFKEIMTMGSKATPAFLSEMHGLVFGRELDNLIRPKRADIVMRLRDQADASPVVAQAVGSIKWATGELAARSPFTKFLTESSNYIADAGRQGALKELADAAYGKSSKLFTPERLKSMSITPEQFEGMKALMKEATTLKDGKLSIVDPAKFTSDPRSMDIWRLGDKIADETILRPHKLSSQDTEAYGAGIKMAMQFKNFTIRSVNARAVRGWHDSTKNGRAIDQTMQAIISTGMAGAMFAALAYSRSAGMPEKDRVKYLKDALNPNTVAYAALSRGSHIGAPLGMANFIMAPLGFDQARMVRTSITPRPKVEREKGAIKYGVSKDDRVQDFLSEVVDQVPAAGWALSAGQVAHSAAGSAATTDRRGDQEYMQSLYNGLRNVIPNDPASQFILMKIMESEGIEAR
ncbi:internal virion protein with endolysin domain [Pseudomonas phage phi15]|uniref:Virion structural protein n=1 Tax=Pseudomonas phage phi15 TaxID=988656 RepID=F0V704_9CAUD|nr:internal virion protein with endolysin domain [Pseudomonas phage phi15]CBZ42016.1 virion structural protein [Pseudomonas phage phi15]